MLGLPFDEVWFIDFEFHAEGPDPRADGSHPHPVCLVAHEGVSGRRLRLWADELERGRPPFRTDPGVLFVAYAAAAEWGCFLQLDWPLPACVIDPFFEFKLVTNGRAASLGVDSKSLLSALSYYHLPRITSDQKQHMRDLILSGGPWTSSQKADILDYCATDVDCLPALLERMLPAIRLGHKGLERAVFRGRYSKAIACMEHVGVPIDTGTLDLISSHWDDIKLDLISEVDAEYGVYEGTSFRSGRFLSYILLEGIPWPRLDSGRLALDADTFRDMARAYPQIRALKELRSTLGEMQLSDLTVGRDGRNRAYLNPFGSKTGRNQPSNSSFIFGPAVWMRSFIQPPPGRALAYIDWSAQEPNIAAYLSRDENMMAAIESGDPYIWLAIEAGIAPPGATKKTHPKERDLCKVLLLGLCYGMGAWSLSQRTDTHLIEANELLRKVERVFPTYFDWSREVTSSALLTLRIETQMGWAQHVEDGTTLRSLSNFPMQAHGAEMMRAAACLLTEGGIDVCAPVHDAFLVEGPADSIHDVVAETKKQMANAAVLVAGTDIKTDAEIVLPGDRYLDGRDDPAKGGSGMFQRVMSLVGRLEKGAVA